MLHRSVLELLVARATVLASFQNPADAVEAASWKAGLQGFEIVCTTSEEGPSRQETIELENISLAATLRTSEEAKALVANLSRAVGALQPPLGWKEAVAAFLEAARTNERQTKYASLQTYLHESEARLARLRASFSVVEAKHKEAYQRWYEHPLSRPPLGNGLGFYKPEARAWRETDRILTEDLDDIARGLAEARFGVICATASIEVTTSALAELAPQLATDQDPSVGGLHSQVFTKALGLHQTFVAHHRELVLEHLRAALLIWETARPPNDAAFRAAWTTLSFLVPVISIPVASLEPVFCPVQAHFRGWLFIDESTKAETLEKVSLGPGAKRAVLASAS